METSTGSRIRDLRLYYKLSVKEFASKSGLSHVAIFHLENGRTVNPHKSSLLRIAQAFGTTLEWLRWGELEMLPYGKKEIENESPEEGLQWKNEMVQELKSKNELLEREVERLWKMVQHLSGQSKTPETAMDIN
jgi:transcriptional regulator with XRE-family HTH domain